MKEPMSHIGECLRRQREALGLTQGEMAGRIGQTQGAVARVERGVRDPRWSTVLEYARALELEPILVPRDKIAAVEAILASKSEAAVPSLAGDDRFL